MSSLNNDQKKRILVFPFDLMSHYLRCITLAKTFTEYNVLFAQSNKYDRFVEQAGFSSFTTTGFDTERAIRCAAMFDFSWLNKADIEKVFLSQVETIKILKPEIVIGDANPSLKMAAEYCGVRYIALMNGYMSRYYARTRKLPSSHPAISHLSKLPPKFGEKIVRFAEGIAMRSVHKPFKQLRKKYHLKKKKTYLDEMEGDENLICDDKELFPQNNLPNSYKFIGPLLYETDSSNKPKHNSQQKITVCVSMGSTGSWQKLAFLSDKKYARYHFITAGDKNGHINGEHIEPLSFVDFNSILPNCKLLICHGGNGTTYHAIKHKLFALCIPDHFEQEWNIQGLEALGYGCGITQDIEETVSTYLNNLTIT